MLPVIDSYNDGVTGGGGGGISFGDFVCHANEISPCALAIRIRTSVIRRHRQVTAEHRKAETQVWARRTLMSATVFLAVSDKQLCFVASSASPPQCHFHCGPTTTHFMDMSGLEERHIASAVVVSVDRSDDNGFT